MARGLKAAALAPGMEGKQEGILYGVLVCALGSIWLAQELGVIATGVPIGPIIIIIIGFLMMLPHLRK